MSVRIDLDWANVQGGAPEERATAAWIGVSVDDVTLTECEDVATRRIADAACLSAYPLSKWLAWNWWRLTTEPRHETAKPDAGWRVAHSMRAVGDGFIWPDITFASDGERCLIVARATGKSPAEPIRYLTDHTGLVLARDFEAVVESAVQRTLDKLRESGLPDTDLHEIWAETCEERADAAAVRYRTLEAMMGFDPDEADPIAIERLIADIADVGESGVRELAATVRRGEAHNVGDLRAFARDHGMECRPASGVRLSTQPRIPAYGAVPAWRRGADGARALREQEKLGQDPVDNRRLAELAGLSAHALDDPDRRWPFAYEVDVSAASHRLVHRSKWPAGRRFDVARLLADGLLVDPAARLLPATASFTYRQKLQKAFAVEFLCPIDRIVEMADGDYSDDSLKTIADFFDVSEMAVSATLKNNGVLPRSADDSVFERLAA